MMADSFRSMCVWWKLLHIASGTAKIVGELKVRTLVWEKQLYINQIVFSSAQCVDGLRVSHDALSCGNNFFDYSG
jgi:catalase